MVTRQQMHSDTRRYTGQQLARSPRHPDDTIINQLLQTASQNDARVDDDAFSYTLTCATGHDDNGMLGKQICDGEQTKANEKEDVTKVQF